MFAQIAQAGMAIGGALYGMNKAGDAADAGSAAAMSAAHQQEEAIRKARMMREAGLEKSLGYLQPYRESGLGGQKLLNDALGINGADAQRAFYSGFQNDPGYEAVQKAGINTVEQSAASRGGVYSGATMKSLMDWGQKFQQSVFGDRLNRLGEVGKLGATAANNSAVVNESGMKDIANLKVMQG